jgi:Asp-tRNA(Asn)/Glu-tRNA(Gln) amidotransferase A subunit family amidase
MLRRLALVITITACAACAPIASKHEQAGGDFDVIELTIAQAHAAFRSNKISCENLTRRYLKRIEAYEQSTKLNAIIYANPNAIAKAVTLDKKFAEQASMKKLHCIPVVLKDNFDTHDMPTEAGSIALKGSLPPDDAFMVKKLREQDAIIIAKSNMGEWAFSPYNTISSTHGETRNAYDLTRVPAGSSGGTASAITANFGVIGMGSDTGNSIRGPASHLSLVGIRSTMGATSRDGIVPLVLNRDIGGPLMRTVTDTAMVYSVIAGFDPADTTTKAVAPPNDNRVKKDYTVYLKQNGLTGARLGVIRQLFDTESADSEVLKAMDRAIAELKKSGAIIIDPFRIKNFDKLKDATGFCSRFYFDINNYLKTLGEQASVRSLDDIVEKMLFRPQNIEAIQWALSEKGDPANQNPPCIGVQGDPRRKAFLDAVVAAMDSNRVDAITYPSWSNPPRKIGDDKSPHGNNSPVIAPHTGQPAITVPMGFTKDGLPVGLQLLARPFDEHKLFQYAFAYEQATKHRKPPAIFGELSQEISE